jgi:hypothetical protein
VCALLICRRARSRMTLLIHGRMPPTESEGTGIDVRVMKDDKIGAVHVFPDSLKK